MAENKTRFLTGGPPGTRYLDSLPSVQFTELQLPNGFGIFSFCFVLSSAYFTMVFLNLVSFNGITLNGEDGRENSHLVRLVQP